MVLYFVLRVIKDCKVTHGLLDNKWRLVWDIVNPPEEKKVPSNLAGADLSEAYLAAADLNGADLRGTRLNGAILSFAMLEKAVFRGASLYDVDFSGALLDGADFSNCFCFHCDFRGADLKNAKLEGARLLACRFNRDDDDKTDPKKGKKAPADLRGASFKDADLHVCRLNGARVGSLDWVATCGATIDGGEVRVVEASVDVNGGPVFRVEQRKKTGGESGA